MWTTKNSFYNPLCLQLLSPHGRWIVLVSIAVLVVVGMEGISRFVLASPFYHIKIGIFGLWSALLLYLQPTYSMKPIITVITECLVCLVAIHSSYSFPWHIMVVVCLVSGRRNDEDERCGITIDTLAYLGGRER